jgi:hypothetical protein
MRSMKARKARSVSVKGRSVGGRDEQHQVGAWHEVGGDPLVLAQNGVGARGVGDGQVAQELGLTQLLDGLGGRTLTDEQLADAAEHGPLVAQEGARRFVHNRPAGGRRRPEAGARSC